MGKTTKIECAHISHKLWRWSKQAHRGLAGKSVARPGGPGAAPRRRGAPACAALARKSFALEQLCVSVSGHNCALVSGATS